MRDILLVRHGKAVDQAPGGDPERGLTDDGRVAIRDVGRALVVLGLVPSAIWHSPYVRARQTAEIIRDATALGELRSEGALAPGSNPERSARMLLDSHEERLLVISHMPLLPALAVELVGARVEFGTGTVAHVIALGPHGSALAGLWSAELLRNVRGAP